MFILYQPNKTNPVFRFTCMFGLRGVIRLLRLELGCVYVVPGSVENRGLVCSSTGLDEQLIRSRSQQNTKHKASSFCFLHLVPQIEQYWYGVTRVLLQKHFVFSSRLSQTYSVLLKQQLDRITKWVTKAEKKMKSPKDIGNEYDDVIKQLNDHQVSFQVTL